MFSGIWRKAKKKNMKKERKFGLKEFPRPLLHKEWRIRDYDRKRVNDRMHSIDYGNGIGN